MFRKGIRFQLLHRTLLYGCCRPNDFVGSRILKIEAAGSAETSVTKPQTWPVQITQLNILTVRKWSVKYLKSKFVPHREQWINGV